MKTRFSILAIGLFALSVINTFAQSPSTWEAIPLSNLVNDSMSLGNKYPHESLTLSKLFFTGGVVWENGEVVETADLAAFDGVHCELIDIGDIKPPITDPPNWHRGIIYMADYLDGIVYAYAYHHNEQGQLEQRSRIAYFDGLNHELLFEFDSPNNKHTVYSVDDVIYVAGELYSGDVVFLKYENGALEPFIDSAPPAELGVHGVYDMIKYQNELYFVLLPSDGPRQLWKYSGTDWSLVVDGNGNAPNLIPTNIDNQVLWLYDNYLLVRCFIGSSTEYNPTTGNGNGVLFWDGQSWSGPEPLFHWPGAAYGVELYYIASLGSDLYVRGTFTSGEGGVPLWGLAKWDGSQWCGLQVGLEVITTPPVPIATFQGSVYLTPQLSWGSWHHIYRHDGETFAPCSVPVNVEEQETPMAALRAFPNPANRNLSVLLNLNERKGIIELHLHDLHGRNVYRQIHPELGYGEAGIEVGHLPGGLYVVHCTVDGERVASTKIVIE